MIKLGKHLVMKAPAGVEVSLLRDYSIKRLETSDINSDGWLSIRSTALLRLLHNGNHGVITLNGNGECVGYCFLASGKSSPSHIHKVPEGSGWIHYWRVKEDHHGRGLGRLLLAGAINFARTELRLSNVYIDTSKNNLPSRINQQRLGCTEKGIYYSVRIGTRRFAPLYFQWGVWFRKRKHPEIKKDSVRGDY